MIPATTGSPPTKGESGARCELARPLSKATTPGFSLPTMGSVKAAVLADLLRGDRITHMDVWRRHGSSRAAHHILRLRQAGWPIITTEIEAPTSDGRTARIALYSLPVETIAEAGERGQRFAAECAKVEAERRAG